MSNSRQLAPAAARPYETAVMNTKVLALEMEPGQPPFWTAPDMVGNKVPRARGIA